MVSITFLSDEEINTLIRYILSIGAGATVTRADGETINIELNGNNFFDDCEFGRRGEVYKNGERFIDLQIFVDNASVFESATHEFYAAADINFLERKLNSRGDMPQLNGEIIKKLHRAVPPCWVEKITAAVTLLEDNLLIKADGKTARFDFFGDKTVEFNADLLEYAEYEAEHADGNAVANGVKLRDFVSGERYFINFFEYNTDVQGVVPKGTVCDLYLELIAQDGRYCDIQITAEKIFCISE